MFQFNTSLCPLAFYPMKSNSNEDSDMPEVVRSFAPQEVFESSRSDRSSSSLDNDMPESCGSFSPKREGGFQPIKIAPAANTVQIAKVFQEKILNLSSRNLLSFPPELYLQYPLLETLDLSYNNIGEIPDEIECFPHLKDLNLDGNRIYRVSEKITKLVNLQTLSVTLDQANPLI